MSKAVLRASVLVAAITGLTLAIAAPAAAAGNSLPASDGLYALTCTIAGTPSLMKVDPATGASTPIGDDIDDCAYNAAFDEVSGKTYFIDYFSGFTLSSIDVVTGATTIGPKFTVDGTAITVDSIAIGAHREAYAFSSSQVFSLNLDTGALTALANFPGFYFYSFAFDKATGQFYALHETGDLFLFNRVALTLDFVGSVPVVNDYTYGLQFDSSGLLWYVDTLAGSTTILFSATLADLANPVESGELVWGEGEGEGYYAFSLAITRPVVPELAATGSDASTFGTGALAAAMLLLLGAGAVVVSRRRTA